MRGSCLLPSVRTSLSTRAFPQHPPPAPLLRPDRGTCRTCTPWLSLSWTQTTHSQLDANSTGGLRYGRIYPLLALAANLTGSWHERTTWVTRNSRLRGRPHCFYVPTEEHNVSLDHRSFEFIWLRCKNDLSICVLIFVNHLVDLSHLYRWK